MQSSDCGVIRFTDRIRTEKCLYDLYKPYGSSKRSFVAQVMRCNCQTVYGPKIVFTIRMDREAVFSDRINLSNRTDRKAVFSDRIMLSILDMSAKNRQGTTSTMPQTISEPHSASNRQELKHWKRKSRRYRPMVECNGLSVVRLAYFSIARVKQPSLTRLNINLAGPTQECIQALAKKSETHEEL